MYAHVPVLSSEDDCLPAIAAIVMSQQSLSTSAPDLAQQFKHSLSLASNSRSDKQRRDALAYLTGQISKDPQDNPVGTHSILAKVLPLISDTSAPVRRQLLKLLRALPENEIRHSAEQTVMFVRAGMTHLSADISHDSLGVMEWLLDAAADDLVTAAGGWVKTLSAFCAMMGWPTDSPKSGWSLGGGGGTRAKDSQGRTRQLSVLAKFLHAGLQCQDAGGCPATLELRDTLYRIPRKPNPFEYLNLTGTRRDEEGEMYTSREARQQVFHGRFFGPMSQRVEEAKKEGGAAGRAAASLDLVLRAGMKDFEPSGVMDTQDLLDLW